MKSHAALARLIDNRDMSRMIYAFHRIEGFYPLGLGSDEEAIANAECNPGTLKVVNVITGETIWTIPPNQ